MQDACFAFREPWQARVPLVTHVDHPSFNPQSVLHLRPSFDSGTVCCVTCSQVMTSERQSNLLCIRLHFKGINEISVIIYSQAIPNHSFFQVRHSCWFFPCNECEGRPKIMAKHHKSSPSELYSKNILIFKFDVAIGCMSHENQ